MMVERTSHNPVFQISSMGMHAYAAGSAQLTISVLHSDNFLFRERYSGAAASSLMAPWQGNGEVTSISMVFSPTASCAEQSLL